MSQLQNIIQNVKAGKLTEARQQVFKQLDRRAAAIKEAGKEYVAKSIKADKKEKSHDAGADA